MSFNSNTFAYHNISNRFNIGINNISPKIFKKHIKFYETLKDVTLCFDDGYEDIFAIKDFINTSKIKPVIFPITNFINRYNDWDVNFFINRKKKFCRRDWNTKRHGKSIGRRKNGGTRRRRRSRSRCRT